ncbi:MAG: hypothetical protein SFU27_02235 [Thermonemataceae bacterium]|nr:hypothetical protein [Thermonemataceae bacterium]
MKNSTNQTKKHLFLAIIFLFIATVGANAQAYDFKVMATNGTVMLKNTKKRVWAGTTLSAADILEISSNSYVGLMHKGGKTMEIKQAGSYKISDLSAKVKGSNSSTSAKYVSYVAGEMSKADRQDINKNHRKYMAITGSVERATYNTACAYFLHENNGKAAEVNLFNSAFTLRMYGNPVLGVAQNKTFAVRILDFYNKVLWEGEAKGDDKGEAFLDIDFAKLNYKGDDFVFIVEVSVKDAKEQPSNRAKYNVTIVKEGEKYDNVKKALAELNQDNEQTALSKIVEAGIYEQEGFILDAATCYEKAIAMEPDVQTYQVAYQDFIARNRMKMIATKGADGKKELRPITINPEVKDTEILKEGAEEVQK